MIEDVLIGIQLVFSIADRRDFGTNRPKFARPTVTLPKKISVLLGLAYPKPRDSFRGHFRQAMRVRRSKAYAKHLCTEFHELFAKCISKEILPGRRKVDGVLFKEPSGSLKLFEIGVFGRR